ncbi:phage major capsid protein [Kocuria oceani]|uniref:Phage major capsid protein n=1 Tax=Kocuria oceani TaxID=988827 RepID=A0ABV9TMY2_9MICC|nr:phage major capsid protein [Kocuria oceani]
MHTKQQITDMLKAAREVADRATADGRSLTDAENRQVQEALAAAKSARQSTGGQRSEADRERAAKSRAQQDELGRLLAGDQGTAGARPSRKAAADAFADRLAKALTTRTADGVNVKSLELSTAAPLLGGTAPALDEVAGPGRQAGIVDLVAVEAPPIGGAGRFAWLSEDVHENNAAVVPEGTLKPTSRYALSEKTDRTKFIAHLSEPFPARLLEDYAGLREFLANRMTEDVLDVLEREALTGDGTAEHLHGILNQTGVTQTAWAGSLPATIRAARTALSRIAEKPSAWMVSPDDAAAFDLFMDAQGRFVDLRQILGPVPVVENPALTAGTAVLGDFGRAKLVTDSQMRITAMDGAPHRNDLGEIDGTLWEFNEVALRAEMRVGGLAITRPTAFTVVDLTAA